MNIQFNKWLTLLGVGVCASLSFAGSIISTNLPSNTYIVNIDATTDGSANSYDGQNHWNSGFGINNKLTLGPGTYSFALVSKADAAGLFPNLTGSQLGQIFTDWTYNSPWITDYFVDDANNNGGPDLFSGGISGRIPNYYSYPGATSAGFQQAGQAYSALKASGMLDQIFVGGRFTGTQQSSFTLAQTTTLQFYIPDGGVYDNAGGVSVIVRNAQAVPEPMTLALISASTLIGLRRKAKR